MSLYTKYRPADFDNLVWQNFIKETLKKAIAEDKTVWAYLFCGPRWTWKTSTARLFAKTINCLNPKDWNPCLECEICKDFAEEKLIDIIEIDAASHTWVDNIREIIEKSQFSPTKTKYKIYIIDEVHMLSKWAFNALLKILEEPPKHVKFILATTETHKVPETIISRCQRYDFKRISEEDIKDRLKFIAKSEKIKIDEKSLNYIIKSSAWWLRNAISLFEQMISDFEIKYKNIEEKLWITSLETLEFFLEKLIKKDNSVIDDFEKISLDWKNLKLFIKDLIFLTKDKSVEKIKLGENINNYINILEILDESYIKSKASVSEENTFLIAILKIISNYELKNGFDKNIKEIEEKKAIISEKKEEKSEKYELKKEEIISEDDLNDIFSENENLEQNGKKEETKKWQNFEISKLLAKLKENKVKWIVIFSLKWAKFNLNWNDLEISVSTKISKNALLNTENSDLIRKSLEDIWLKNITLTIK